MYTYIYAYIYTYVYMYIHLADILHLADDHDNIMIDFTEWGATPPKSTNSRNSNSSLCHWFNCILNQILNLNLHREIPRNLSFSILGISGMLYFQWNLSYSGPGSGWRDGHRGRDHVADHVTNPQYWFNKTKQHTHRKTGVACRPSYRDKSLNDELKLPVCNFMSESIANKMSDVENYYGVATVSRIDKIVGLFCRISSLLWGLLQKRPIILSILLTKATPYWLGLVSQRWPACQTSCRDRDIIKHRSPSGTTVC